MARPAVPPTRVKQLRLCWKYPLDNIVRQLNPLHDSIFQPWPQTYYWSAYQTEWATDLLFRDQPSATQASSS